jgi:hypothetical protein
VATPSGYRWRTTNEDSNTAAKPMTPQERSPQASEAGFGGFEPGVPPEDAGPVKVYLNGAPRGTPAWLVALGATVRE